MLNLTDRPYQTESLEAIRENYAKGIKRVMLHLATGAGKTYTFCKMLKQAYEKGTPSLVVVRGVKLIEQASRRLAAEGVPHGIYQGSNSRGHHHIVQVCSIDTLYRQKKAPQAKFLVIDEAHQTGGEAYKWFLEQYKDAYILGVSATPHLRRGLRHIADALVYPISIKELMIDKYLVEPKYYSCDVPNLDQVRIKQGEFNEKQLEVVMRKTALKGNIPLHYKRFADGRPALMFAVTVEHSKLLVEQLRSAGIPAEHVDAKSSDEERQQKIDDLTAGRIKVLSNVGILTTGFDCPPVSCLILARPTMSYNLHIQMIGRGTRTFAGKTDFIVLDHAGNVARHGPIEDERAASLDERPKQEVSAPSMLTPCIRCGFFFHNANKFCPQCGEENANAPKRNTKMDENVTLKEIFVENVEVFFNRLKVIAKQRGYKKWWILQELRTKFGQEVADQYQPVVYKMKQWKRTNIPHSSERLSEVLTKEMIAVFGSTTPEVPKEATLSSNLV